MKRIAKLIVSILLVILTVHMTVGVTFSRCVHSGKLTYGLSHEAENDGGDNGFHCGCLEVFSEILPEYAPSDGVEFDPVPATPVAVIRTAVPVLPLLHSPLRPLSDSPPAAVRLLGSVLLRR